jgi:hypothetical protein
MNIDSRNSSRTIILFYFFTCFFIIQNRPDLFLNDDNRLSYVNHPLIGEQPTIMVLFPSIAIFYHFLFNWMSISH